MINFTHVILAFFGFSSLVLSHPSHPLGAEIMVQEASKPLLTGSGVFSFKTVPNWGVFPESLKTATHGGVAVASDGRVFVGTESPASGILVFDAEGSFLEAWGKGSENGHGMAIHSDSNGEEFLYVAHTKSQKVVKYDLEGQVVLSITSDPEAGINFAGVTAITATPSGEIFAATGYGANEVFKFDAQGKLLKKTGSRGGAIDQFQTPHGMKLDTRFETPRLLIADREKKRLVHFSLDLEFIGVHARGLRRPCAVVLHGDHAAVAELQGRVTVLNKAGEPIAFLGDNPDSSKWAKFNVPREEMYHGIFTAPHGLAWDGAGNLIVQDWNIKGRVTRLDRVYPEAAK